MLFVCTRQNINVDNIGVCLYSSFLASFLVIFLILFVLLFLLFAVLDDLWLIADGLTGFLGFLHDLENVLVAELVLMATSHRRKLATFAPNIGRLKLIHELSMNLRDGFLDGNAASTCCQDNRILKIRRLSSLLGVDADHAQLFPNLLKQDIEAELHVNRNATAERILRNGINLLNRNGINLVINIDALDILSVALNHINKLINIVVTPEHNMRIMHFVFL